MLLGSRRITFLGLLLSVAVLLILAGNYIEPGTLFFLSAASFCIGIALRETDMRLGFGFWVAATLTGFILSPNKLYVFTFSAMGIYVLLSELAFDKIALSTKIENKKKVLWLAKYFIFNWLYLPTLLIFPELLISKKLNFWVWMIAFLAGQGFLWIYDRAYLYFQG
ncbi:MAG: hypothetical protein JW708_06820, partial [Vallitaleaceae bacterium]|nr:hypothetical protein [Vallitaleaceae bacterium]